MSSRNTVSAEPITSSSTNSRDEEKVRAILRELRQKNVNLEQDILKLEKALGEPAYKKIVDKIYSCTANNTTPATLSALDQAKQLAEVEEDAAQVDRCKKFITPKISWMVKKKKQTFSEAQVSAFTFLSVDCQREMNWIFGRKLSEKEQARANERELRAANRHISSELRQLERAEKELASEIKKLLKAGHREACKVLAKQLLQLRNQKMKNISLSANISSMSSKNKLVISVNAVSRAIGNVTGTMKAVEKQLPLAKFAQEMREYTQAQDKMAVREEMVTEAMDSALEPIEDDEENKLIDQILDEIGLEISEKLSKVPNIKSDNLGPVRSDVRNEVVLDLEKRFAKLNN